MTKYRITVERAGLGVSRKTVHTETLDSKSSSFEEDVENWFGSGSFDYVMGRLERHGSYGEAVGQGLAGRIERISP